LADSLPDADALRRLGELRRGAAQEEVLAFFDSLPVVRPGEMVGRWRGSGLPTGSPLDGLLEAYGWWGKEVVDAETVHPLLFADQRGAPRPVNPAFAPLWLLRSRPGLAHWSLPRRLFPVVRPLVRTGRPTARIREIAHRGATTAALVYDRLPIVDVLRRVTDDILLGLMDMRGLNDPFAFVLTREPPSI
jgi:hypothetical protein